MNFKNLPQTKEGKEFEQMFMTAFKPMQDYIKYNNLESRLTEEDVHLFVHALGQGMVNWCEFLRMAKTHKEER